MESEAGDSIVRRHFVVAEILILTQSSNAILQQPAPASGGPEVEPEIVDMQHESAARFQDAMDMSEGLASIGRARDHAKRAEHTGRTIERTVTDAIQLNQIRSDQRHLNSASPHFLRRHFQHGFRKVDTQNGKAAPSERDG